MFLASKTFVDQSGHIQCSVRITSSIGAKDTLKSWVLLPYNWRIQREHVLGGVSIGAKGTA